MQAVWADPFAHGIQAFDEAERGGGVTCVGYAAGGLQFAQRAVTDRNRHDPTLAFAVVALPEFAVSGRSAVMPVDARKRKPCIEAGGRGRARLQLLQA